MAEGGEQSQSDIDKALLSEKARELNRRLGLESAAINVAHKVGSLENKVGIVRELRRKKAGAETGIETSTSLSRTETVAETLKRQRSSAPRTKSIAETRADLSEPRSRSVSETRSSAPRSMTVEEQKRKEKMEREATLPTKNTWEMRGRGRAVPGEDPDKLS